MRDIKRVIIPSRTSPKSGKRGCLCRDGRRYSRECCNGDIMNQGIGNIGGRHEND